MKPFSDQRTANALEDVKRKAASDIEDTKRKISNDVIRRRTILRALDYITRTGFLIHMNKMQPDLAKIMTPKNPLLKDLLRLAPSNLRDGALPLIHLEDVVSLFDAAEEGSYLP